MTKLRDVELNVVVRYLDHQVPVTLAFVPAREQFVWTDVPVAHPIDQHVCSRSSSRCG